jgi:hypothetical protein
MCSKYDGPPDELLMMPASHKYAKDLEYLKTVAKES